MEWKRIKICIYNYEASLILYLFKDSEKEIFGVFFHKIRKEQG